MAHDETDLLISRVIDQRATNADWARLESIASQDATVWSDLASGLKIEQQLRSRVLSEVSKADEVNISTERVIRHPAQASRAGLNARRIGSWGGWIAATLLVAFSLRGTDRVTNVQGASVAGVSTNPRDILSHYLNSGKRDGSVVGEMPEKVLLNTARAEDGGTYVIFIRQIVEKVKVEDLYRISTDESGRPTPVRILETPPAPRGPAM